MKPAMITIGVFQIEAAWNGFLWPLMITTSDSIRPLQLGLAIFAQNPAEIQWPYLMAGTALAALPMIARFIFAQKRFVEGRANVGTKGTQPRPSIVVRLQVLTPPRASTCRNPHPHGRRSEE